MFRRIFCALHVANVVAIGVVGLAACKPPGAAVLEVYAEDGYLIDESGVHIGGAHVGRRLRIANVAEVRGVDLQLANVDSIVIHGREQIRLRLEEVAANKNVNVCKQRSDGSDWLIPLKGRWREQGSLDRDALGATLACASGALGKCMEWGFSPSLEANDFAACTRMVRADYCGDGRSHTVPGVRIAFDRLPGDSSRRAPENFIFEAFWNPDGAHCVKATRVPKLFAIDALLKECPERVAGSSTSLNCDAWEKSPPSSAIFANFIAAPTLP